MLPGGSVVCQTDPKGRAETREGLPRGLVELAFCRRVKRRGRIVTWAVGTRSLVHEDVSPRREIA